MAFDSAKRCGMALLLVFSWLGCATAPAVRLELGLGKALAYAPPSEPNPVVVTQGEFLDAVSRLVLTRHLSLQPEQAEWGRVRFTSWSSMRAPVANVLSLDARERRNLALSSALDTVWEGVEAAVRVVVDPVALKAMVSSALCAYLMLLTVPEPVTKFIAIALSAYLVAYVGVGPLWNMVTAFKQLRDEAEQATSFARLEEIGHRFGRVMGDNGARVLIMVVLAAASGRAGMAAEGPTLPGYAQAALAAETRAGFQLAAVAAGGVQSIAMTAGALTVGLAPTAVAASAWRPDGHGGGAELTKVTSPNQLQQQVERGLAPREVTRVDKGRPDLNEKPHVHLEDGRALNQDGTWKHGDGSISNAVRDWLIENGWMVPK